MMKTANEMFEELGYKLLQNKYTHLIMYQRETPQHSQRIVFELDKKKFSCTCLDDNYIRKGLRMKNRPMHVDTDHLKAINKQCEELGWLDDKNIKRGSRMTAQQELDTLISKTSIMNDTCANLGDCLKDGKCRFKVDDNNDCEDYKIAKTLQELVERATPMKFINKCNCIFDEHELYDAIDVECRNRNSYRNEEYTIYLDNGYPTISIRHDKVRIHVLLGKLIYGRIRKGYVIHHKDFNKLNAITTNLEYLSNSAHTKLHHTGIDYRTEDGKSKSINSAKEKIYRKEIKKEDIETMMKQGKSKQEIAKSLNCGVNTIYRRLGYKF